MSPSPNRGAARSGRNRTLLWLPALVCVASCAAWEPDLGPPTPLTCDNSDSNPDQSVSFKLDVFEAILKPNCLPCHDPKGAAPVGFTNGGLDLTELAGLRMGGKVAGLSIVQPYNPCSSYLVNKLVGVGQSGERMPVGADSLSDAQIQTVRDWIAEGARDN